MTPSEALQKAVFEALKADTAVAAIVGARIYDRMPSDGDYPCLTFGPSDALPDDMDGITATAEVLQIDGWRQDQGRLRPARGLVGAVKAALHNVALDLEMHSLARIKVSATRVFLDRDGITAHGVITLEAVIEERA